MPVIVLRVDVVSDRRLDLGSELRRHVSDTVIVRRVRHDLLQ